jgi:hypothetical protein
MVGFLVEFFVSLQMSAVSYFLCSRLDHMTDFLSSVPYKGISKSFRTDSITKYTRTIINTRWEAKQRVMSAKLTRLTHKIAIQLHVVAESCTICSSRPQATSPETFGYTLVYIHLSAEQTSGIRTLKIDSELQSGIVICYISLPTLSCDSVIPLKPPFEGYVLCLVIITHTCLKCLAGLWMAISLFRTHIDCIDCCDFCNSHRGTRMYPKVPGLIR